MSEWVTKISDEGLTLLRDFYAAVIRHADTVAGAYPGAGEATLEEARTSIPQIDAELTRRTTMGDQ